MVTVIAGSLLYYFQNDEPKLQYSTEKVLPFESQTGNLIIYHITIENTGSAPAENIVCRITIPPAIIREFRVNSEAPIPIIDSLNSQKIDISTPSLNSNESYRVSILASANGEFPEKPQIKLRAKGISGEEKPSEGEKSKQPDRSSTHFLVLIASTATALTLIFSRIRSSGSGSLNQDKHDGKKNETFAYICGIHGLQGEVDRYLALPNLTSYWSEMDRLASLGVNQQNQSTANRQILILKDIMKYTTMAVGSRGIGHYNLARLYKSLEDKANCDLNLKSANKLIPDLLKLRLSVDPLFKDYAIDLQ